MIFVAAIDTPANTASTAPKVTRIPITAGTINKVAIFFPPGADGLAHLALWWGLYQLFPSNQGGDFAIGGAMIDWTEDIVIAQPPLELVAVTWNDDDTYDHTISVHIAVTPATLMPNPQHTIAQLMGG